MGDILDSGLEGLKKHGAGHMMSGCGLGFTDRILEEEDVAAVCDEAIAGWAVDGKRVLLVIPDSTRTCPMGLMFRLLYERLAPRVESLSILIALGTHAPMTDEQIYERVGITAEEHRTTYAKARFFNHLYQDPDELIEIGTFSKREVSEISDGLFELDVTVTCNRMIADNDVAVIVGPVFPHEVVGFSGGNKYLFPGIAGEEIIGFFHWLGAVITIAKVIGWKHTPVRGVVDRAAALLDIDRKALCLVVKGKGLAGLYCGDPEDAWSDAADLSAKLHIRHVDRLYHTVLSCAPPMYDDLWTGAKCTYKVESAVADGGRIIIHAPHITEVSVVHGKVLHEIGYHTRDFFVKQWDKYKHHPWGVIAHSTHVKGLGTYENGVEKPRTEVILATGIPEETCRRINLGYMDYRAIDKADYEGKEDEGVLHVPRAGEVLYRYDHGLQG